MDYNKKKITNRLIVLLILLILLVVIDQITKEIANNSLQTNDVIIIKDFIKFSLVYNTGAAYGLFDNFTFVLTIFTIIIVPILIYFIYRIENVKKITNNIEKHEKTIKKYNIIQMIIVLILAGAIGNLIDRIRLNYVVDFINAYFIDFPVFNIADCYITVATTALIITIFFLKNDEFDMLFSKKIKANKNEDITDNIEKVEEKL